MLQEYSYIWEEEKEKYVLLRDKQGDSIFFIGGEKLMFFLMEDEDLMKAIVAKMTEKGNKVYENFEELKTLK